VTSELKSAELTVSIDFDHVYDARKNKPSRNRRSSLNWPEW
jgi:hypothetical protein